jgi:hypothetical protein
MSLTEGRWRKGLSPISVRFLRCGNPFLCPSADFQRQLWPVEENAKGVQDVSSKKQMRFTLDTENFDVQDRTLTKTQLHQNVGI